MSESSRKRMNMIRLEGALVLSERSRQETNLTQ